MKNQEQKKAAAKAAGKVTPVSGMQLCILDIEARRCQSRLENDLGKNVRSEHFTRLLRP